MINVAHGTQIYLATGATDMRRGFDGLQGQIANVLKEDPLSGHLFLFFNRRRDRLKLLYWDTDGLAIWYKRLSSGTFQVPGCEEGQTHIKIKNDDLVMLLRGIDLKSKRRRGRKGKLPADLPREIIRHELAPEQRACPCCGQERHEIGVETSEQLELIPAVLKVIQHDRVKYACRNCQTHGTTGSVVIADKPPQPIHKGLPAAGLCAYAVLSKFGDHQPLYRTEDITSRFGYTIRRSTLCGWQAQLAELALPLVLRMKFLLLQSNVIHTDDTSIKLLEGKGVAHTAKSSER